MSNNLKKMSRPKIRFPNLPKVSTRPDQDIQTVENGKQQDLFSRKVANAIDKDQIVPHSKYNHRPDGSMELVSREDRLLNRQPQRDATAKNTKSQYSGTVNGFIQPTPKADKPYYGTAVAGKLRSKFEDKSTDEFKDKKAQNQLKDKEALKEYNKKLLEYADANKGKITYSDLVRFQKENKPKKTITRAKVKATKDLTPEQQINRGRSTDSTIEHEAAHGLFQEIKRHYGEGAAIKVRKHLLHSFHPETVNMMANLLQNKHGYSAKTSTFPEEILNHSRDMLVNPAKRQKLKEHLKDENEYNKHIKNLKQGVRTMHERAKAITPEWLAGTQSGTGTDKLAASELSGNSGQLKKARIDQGKSVDQKRQDRNQRAESWERENYGMGSGKSSNPEVSKFLHNAKLHQIKDTPKPKLNKAEKKTPKKGETVFHARHGKGVVMEHNPETNGAHIRFESAPNKNYPTNKKLWINSSDLNGYKNLNKAQLEHYSSQQNLKQIDPKYKKTGVDSTVKGRDTEHPHSFYYRAGTAPEDIVRNQAKSKYLIDLPDNIKLYDIGTDPMNFSDQVRNENNGAFNFDKMHEKIKTSGHEGFHNSTHPHLGNVVALYHSQDVKNENPVK